MIYSESTDQNGPETLLSCKKHFFFLPYHHRFDSKFITQLSFSLKFLHKNSEIFWRWFIRNLRTKMDQKHFYPGKNTFFFLPYHHRFDSKFIPKKSFSLKILHKNSEKFWRWFILNLRSKMDQKHFYPGKNTFFFLRITIVLIQNRSESSVFP